MASVRDLLRVGPLASDVHLADVDPRSTPGTDMDKAQARTATAALGPRLADLQERLWAEGLTGGRRRVLVVLQGMDTSGKGGAVKALAGPVNPRGAKVVAFGPPTELELAQDFLCRIEQQVPAPGMLGVFDRSHYEDVLVVRVRDLVPETEWQTRYDRINDWEQRLAGEGVVFLKVMLHISKSEQRDRLLARLDRPDKHWKVNPGDLDDRLLWEDFQSAYEAVLERCSTPVAPFHVVPADRKWYRDWALSCLLLETLEDMDPQWPVRPELDIAGMRAALRNTVTVPPR
jgi:PPK2 family polyphosphate:nucleotide phosphotransferase